MPDQRPDAPSADEKIDIFISKVYPYNDEEHPEVRVLFGSYDYNGNPMPIMQIRDANTGELLTEFIQDYVNADHRFSGPNPPEPPYEAGDIWDSNDGPMIAINSRAEGEEPGADDWIPYRDGYKVAKNYISIDEQSGIIISENATWYRIPYGSNAYRVEDGLPTSYKVGDILIVPTGKIDLGGDEPYEVPTNLMRCIADSDSEEPAFDISDWDEDSEDLVGNMILDSDGVHIRRGLFVKNDILEDSITIRSQNDASLTMGINETDGQPHLKLQASNDYIDITSQYLEMYGGDTTATMSSSYFNISQLESQSMGFYNPFYQDYLNPTVLSEIGWERRSNGHLSMKRWDRVVAIQKHVNGSGDGASSFSVTLPNNAIRVNGFDYFYTTDDNIENCIVNPTVTNGGITYRIPCILFTTTNNMGDILWIQTNLTDAEIYRSTYIIDISEKDSVTYSGQYSVDIVWHLSNTGYNRLWNVQTDYYRRNAIHNFGMHGIDWDLIANTTHNGITDKYVYIDLDDPNQNHPDYAILTMTVEITHSTVLQQIEDMVDGLILGIAITDERIVEPLSLPTAIPAGIGNDMVYVISAESDAKPRYVSMRYQVRYVESDDE